MNSNQSSKYYSALIVLAVILSIITFTSLVIPYETHEPSLFYLPYTLWTGLIVALLFILLTYLATRVHPGKEEKE